MPEKRETVFAHMMVRGGGSTFHRKNVYPLFGKPVIRYAIEACQASGCVDQVFVWTESEEIKAIARQAGAVALDRPREMVHYCSGFASMTDWNTDRFGQVMDLCGTTGDVHLSLNCNNILIRPETLRAMYALLQETPEAMRVTAIRRVEPGLCLVNPNTAYLMPFWNDPHTKPEDHPPLYRMVGASFSSAPRQQAGRTGTRFFEVSREEGFDFQNAADVPLAEFYLARRLGLLPSREDA
jgi:CMP-N-acetylneuraminic acid synthetase